MVPGTDRVLADLKMYTDLSTHYLRGMIVLIFKERISNLYEMRKKIPHNISFNNYSLKLSYAVNSE